MNAGAAAQIGVVVIGRNEGERLARCLASVADGSRPVVYVDSGSTDGSPLRAREAGVAVIELDPSRPFTAARGRNAGLAWIRRSHPAVSLVQFVDGDTALVPDWMSRAAAHLTTHPRVGAVFGALRERAAEASIYNRLSELEWNFAPPGEAGACGGIAMMRGAAVVEAGGYDESLRAGEEPDLCLRLRRKNWTIERLDAEMGAHDAAMTRFGQWWKRSARAGSAYAEAAWRHGADREHAGVRPVGSALAWGVAMPLAALGLVWPTGGWSLLLLLAYPVQWWRLSRGHADRKLGRAFATFTMLSKFAQVQGIGAFLARLATGRTRRRSVATEESAVGGTPVHTGAGGGGRAD